MGLTGVSQQMYWPNSFFRTIVIKYQDFFSTFSGPVPIFWTFQVSGPDFSFFKIQDFSGPVETLDNTTQNSSDNLPSYFQSPDNHNSSDVVYQRRKGGKASGHCPRLTMC